MLQDVTEAMFVKGSLSAMRLLTATKLTSIQHVEVLSRQLWNRIWGRVSGMAKSRNLLNKDYIM